MEEKKIKVWDIAVRLFHWSLVAAFVIAYLSGDELENLHEIAGYVVLGLVAFRIVWGLIGPKYARFSNFVYGPGKVVEYLKGMLAGRPEHYVGHNPAGGYMIIMLLVGLLLTSWSGIEAQEPAANGVASASVITMAYADGWEGDEHEHDGHGEGDEFWEEIHEFFANFMLLLIAVHLGGVLVGSLMHRENLVRAMVTGYKEKS